MSRPTAEELPGAQAWETYWPAAGALQAASAVSVPVAEKPPWTQAAVT